MPRPRPAARYAIASQFTRAVRDLAERFEHRLFLSATPHNGHSNSFSALLEMLDPQRFTRGVEVRPEGSRARHGPPPEGRPAPPRRSFPEAHDRGRSDRRPAGRRARTRSWRAACRLRRAAECAASPRLPAQKAALAKLAFVGLQQRLLSSIAAFARTLEGRIAATLQRLIDGEAARRGRAAAAQAFVDGSDDRTTTSSASEDDDAESRRSTRTRRQPPRPHRVAGAVGAHAGCLAARTRRGRRRCWRLRSTHAAEARCPRALAGRMDQEPTCSDGRGWNDRRLIIFTEYEDTRRWLERRLREAHRRHRSRRRAHRVFTGATGQDRREEVKRAFNADPTKEPLRILICTDAAREGINLQTYCADLVHFDLPWNPSRLEQRNGRIDRKLQPAKQIICRYFRYEQREADIVLEALVRKTETIREAARLRRPGDRGADRQAAGGGRHPAGRGGARSPRRSRTRATPSALRAPAPRWTTTSGRATSGSLKEQHDLRSALEESRERVGVEPDDCRRVVGVALARAGYRSRCGRGPRAVGTVETFRLDPADPAFADEPGWADAFDDLRVRPRKRGERLNEWRRDAPVRSIAFEPPVLGRRPRRAGRRAGASRAPAGPPAAVALPVAGLPVRPVARLRDPGPGAQPRVVLIGRLASTAPAPRGCTRRSSRSRRSGPRPSATASRCAPLGESGEERRPLNQLEDALRTATPAPPMAVARVQALIEQDVADLRPDAGAARRRAPRRRSRALLAQARRGGGEVARRPAGAPAQADRQGSRRVRPRPAGTLALGIADEERREREADRRHWAEPARAASSRRSTTSPSASAHPTRSRRTGWSRSASSISGRLTG